eukprot:PRCOL_00002090-RA
MLCAKFSGSVVFFFFGAAARAATGADRRRTRRATLRARAACVGEAASEVEATLQRINGHRGVIGTIIVDKEGVAIRSSCEADVTAQYARLVPQLASMARSAVRDLDPQNDLQFLRLRSKQHEILVAPDPEFTLIVIQEDVVEAEAAA